VISPFAMAEEIASVNNTKENLNASIDGSDEVEWQVVWQDETGTASDRYGDPEFIFIAYGVYLAYVAYAAVAVASAYIVVSGVAYIVQSEKVKQELNTLSQKAGKKIDEVFTEGGLYYDNRKGNCPNIIFLPIDGKTRALIAYKIRADTGERIICHAKYQRLPTNAIKVNYETIGDN